jgi:Domain of unknown function (DUF4133)
MGNSLYKINKGIHKSIEFKGLKAQYIWYLGGGILILLIGFAIMYILGVNSYVCVGLILVAGFILFMYVFRMSSTYGEYGLMKKIAKRSIPPIIKSNSRDHFVK